MRYTLTITDVRPEDAGKYEVVAINAAGEARCEAQVSLQDAPAPVAVAPAKPAEEPKFVKALIKETRAEEGEKLTITTQVVCPGNQTQSLRQALLGID